MAWTLSGLRREGGISLNMRQGIRASASVEGRISCFSSSRGRVPLRLRWDHTDPLVVPLGGPVSRRVSRGPMGFLFSRCQGRGPHLDLSPEPQGSSPGPICILGSSGAFTGESDLISPGAMQVHYPLELEKQCQSSCRIDYRDQCFSLEVPPSCHTCHCVLSQSPV